MGRIGLALALCAVFAVAVGVTSEPALARIQTAGRSSLKPRGAKPPPKTTAVVYHGGPVMLGTPNIYYIWYGNWTGNEAVGILTDFANNIGGSPYFNTNTVYYNGAGNHVSGLVNYAGSTTDNYSQGTALSDAQVQAVVSGAITSGSLPSDTNGVYFVLTSADVNVTSGLDTQYCGWHTHATVAGSDIKYALVGDTSRAPSSCQPQPFGPNGTSGADGTASIIAHELDEAVTDPDLNAWYDNAGNEVADKCAWTFGTTYTVANGALANMLLGARDYLIQQNWVDVFSRKNQPPTGYCAKSYP